MIPSNNRLHVVETVAVELRPELMPPALDEAKVLHLAGLATQIDGANPGQWEDELAEFNREAGTAFEFIDFQGIYGGQDPDTWVRQAPLTADAFATEFEHTFSRILPRYVGTGAGLGISLTGGLE